MKTGTKIKAWSLKLHLCSKNATKVTENRLSRGFSLQICSWVGSHGFRLSALLRPARIGAVLKLNISFRQNKEAKKNERKLFSSAPFNSVWSLKMNKIYFFLVNCILFVMHLAKNIQISMSEGQFATTRYFFIYLLLIVFPTRWKHSAALQTASVTDDRFMKRLQSRPATRFCTYSKKHSVMSGWFQRAGGHTNVPSIICGHAQMGAGETREGQESLIQQNVIWYWITVNIVEWHELGAQTPTHFTHTCPADDCSYSIMSIHWDGFNGI